MRLWTWQSKDCVESLKDKGIWYSTNGGRTRRVDVDYIVEENIDWGNMDTYPIYTIARIYQSVPTPLCLSTFCSILCTLIRTYNIDMDTNYMLELDVPEGYILNMKDMDKPYIKYSDGMPKKLSRWQRAQYEEVINEDLVVKTGFGKYVSSNNLNIEALLPYIKKEWVICVRSGKFECSRHGGEEYLVYDTDVWAPELCPTWEKTVRVGGDGYLRDQFGDVESLYMRAMYLPSNCPGNTLVRNISLMLAPDIVKRYGDLLKELGYEYNSVKDCTLVDLLDMCKRR